MNPYLYCSGAFTALNHDLRQRMIFGGNRPCWSLKSVVPDFLLETFECSKDDRHMLYNDELQDCPGYQCRFCPEDNYSHACLIAKEDGRVVLIDTNVIGSSSIINSYKAHNNCIFDIQWIDRHTLLTCSGDSSVRHHSLETNQVVSRFTSHSGSVKALSLRPKHTSQFVSCSRDGSVLLWDMRSQATSHDSAGQPSLRPVTSILNAHHTDLLPSVVQGKMEIKRKSLYSANNNMTPKTVTSVNFVDDNTIVSSGASDGKIKFWDIRKLSKKNVTPVKLITYPCSQDAIPGYTDLVVNKAGTTLFANCKDNFVYQYDLGSKNFDIPKYRYTGHESKSFYLKMDLSPDENYLVCGSSSFSPYIYRLGLVPQRPVILNGHQGEVTVCRWCPSNQGIITTISDDCTAMIHRMRPGSQYNVFYRDLTRHTRPNNHQTAPVSLSSRYGEETVTALNQISQRPVDISYDLLASPFPFPRSNPGTPQLLSTPKKMKDQSIGSFLSPVTTCHKSPLPQTVPLRRTLDELCNRHNLPHTKIDRSKSIQIKKPNTPLSEVNKKRAQPHDSVGASTHNHRTHSSDNNKENIKRRKTILGQLSITNFLKPNNNQ